MTVYFPPEFSSYLIINGIIESKRKSNHGLIFFIPGGILFSVQFDQRLILKLINIFHFPPWRAVGLVGFNRGKYFSAWHHEKR